MNLFFIWRNTLKDKTQKQGDLLMFLGENYYFPFLFLCIQQHNLPTKMTRLTLPVAKEIYTNISYTLTELQYHWKLIQISIILLSTSMDLGLIP